jgi:hypothetical protein
MGSTLPRFAPENGKLALAELLFARHKYLIRCPTCPGNSHQPGFIKDQAGKTTSDGLTRRQWACQRSNGRLVAPRCSRVSCTEYIGIAQIVLDPAQFRAEVEEILDQQDSRDSRDTLLGTYLLPRVSNSTISDLDSSSRSVCSSAEPQGILGWKRKASIDDEEPVRPVKQRQISANGEKTERSLISMAAVPLSELVDIGKLCAVQLAHLDLWLASSQSRLSPRPALSSFPSVSKPTPVHLFSNALSSLDNPSVFIPRPSFYDASVASSSSSLHMPDVSIPRPPPHVPNVTASPSTIYTSSVEISPDILPDGNAPPPSSMPEKVIPSTYPDDTLSSSFDEIAAAQDQLDSLHGLREAKKLSQAGARMPRSSPPPAPSSAATRRASIPTPDSMTRADQLVQCFRASNPAQRQQIRKQARDDGVYPLFQQRLKHLASHSTTAAEPKSSDEQ